MSYDIDYLTLLSQQYPTVKAASTEIIRLQSRQKLPKLTEHFMSDIHGEYESFLHILKNASGVIKDKITQIYGRTLSERDRQVLATLIYYPEQKLEYIKDEVDDINDWYKITLYRLIEICCVKIHTCKNQRIFTGGVRQYDRRTYTRKYRLRLGQGNIL